MQVELIKNIEKAIQQSIKTFVKNIVNRYDNVDEKVLLALWKDEQDSSSVTEKKEDSPLDMFTEGCPYKCTKGKNVGKICGVKSKDGSQYCSTHKKYEGQEQKGKKVVPEPKKTSPKSPTKSPVAKTATPPVFRKHKVTQKLYHSETNLVIESPQNRVVIGKIVDDKVEPLTDEDIETCKQWGFQFQKEQPEVEETKEEQKPKKSSKKEDVEETKKPNVKPKKAATVEKSSSKKTPSSKDTEGLIAELDSDSDLESTVTKKALGIKKALDNDEDEDDEDEDSDDE